MRTLASQTYTNPRLTAVITDWPYGQYRTTATFTIETHPTRGQRGARTTIDPKTGRVSKPKVLTYARRARIVDGADGKTYILNDCREMLQVMQSNMQYQQESVFPGDAHYAELMALFD